MYGEGSIKLDNTLNDIKETIEEIKKVQSAVFTLRKNIDNLHDVIKDSTQIINSIQYNTERIQNHIYKSNEQLDDTNKLILKAQDVN